jgi:hypothetical protein
MRDFVDGLEQRLVMSARAQKRRRSLPRRPRGRWLAIAAAVAAGAAATVIGVSAGPGSTPAFAVLSRPATDARDIRHEVPALVRAGADLKDARQIATPAGPGYVTRSATGLCLAIPDPIDGYGESCATDAEMQRRGLTGALVAAQPGGLTYFVAVLPAGASEPVVTHADGHTETLALDDGVAVTTVRDDVTITLRVGDDVQTLPIPAHEPAMEYVCTYNGPHGHYKVMAPPGNPNHAHC